MQVAPYHLRLDWLMWFAAMSQPSDYEWFAPLLVKLLQGDEAALGLLRVEPVPGSPSALRPRPVLHVPLHVAR